MRQLELLKRLCNADGLSIDQLAESLGVTRRTVYRDLDLLTDLGVSLQKTGSGNSVFYSATPQAFQEVMDVTSDVTHHRDTKTDESKSQKERI